MPSLVKLANALRVTGAGLEDFCEKTVAGEKVNAKQLPAELALPEQYQFAPIFVCPVSRDACEPPKKPTAGDPVAQQCADARGDYPTMLPCGLILSANSIENMGKQRVESKRGMTMPLGAFKCPYCSEIYEPKECEVFYVQRPWGTSSSRAQTNRVVF